MKIRIEDQDGKKTYYVNDVAYSRLEDIPEEHRHHFADSNNNGMPDQFDSLFDLARGKGGAKDVFKTLVKGLKTNVQDEKNSQPAATPSKGRYLQEERSQGGGFPFYVKVLIFSLIGFSAALFIISRLPKSSESPVTDETYMEDLPTEEAVTEVTPEPAPEEAAVNPEEFRFVVEDPNEPPYKMFTNVFQGNTLLFAIDVPPGKIFETASDRLAIDLETPAGTNLSAAVFDATILTDQCLTGEVEEWTTKKIGATEYKTALVTGSGAGHTYNTYYYVLSGAYCAQFTLTLKSVNAGISDATLREYNPDYLVGLVEDVLRTARFE